MPAVTIDGEEYWAGRHPRFGLVVHAVRWQEGLPSDRVRLLVVSEQRLGTFDRAVVRRIMGSRHHELSAGDKANIATVLRAMARSLPVSYRPQRALELLQKGTRIPDATFRSGQEEAIRHVVEGRGRLLVVEKTGWERASSISSRPCCFGKRRGVRPCLFLRCCR